MAAPTTYLTVIKRMPYRGDANEEWSNSYALSGSTPADSAAWRTLFDALVVEEKKVYLPEVEVIGGYGYDGIPTTGDHALWTVDLRVSPNSPVAGTFSGAGARLSGDQAAWVRWGLDRYANGKRVYLRKYFHGGMSAGSTNTDLLLTGYATALTAFGAKMRDGSFSGARTLVDKLGNVPIGHGVSPYITTRTLKRRGKRPGT